MVTPTPESVLRQLSAERLRDISREFGVGLPPSNAKDELVRHLIGSGAIVLPALVRAMGRDELRAACKAHGLDVAGRARAALWDRLLTSAGVAVTAPAASQPSDVPRRHDVVQLRHRQYLVEDVAASAPGEQTRVKLVCLDDDAQGRELEVVWELELGARILEPESHGLGDIRKIDEPRVFGAYLHALKWSCVSATDAKLFQSPFRAGIKIFNHQLTPLKKALELPRANLFIADDVGLGKTIEAGLVLQELLMRQRVDWTLVACPASVSLQWRDEMEKRFGLRFEIFNRAFVARRRQERGFAINPWSTHSRFIISYQTLRRPEYRDPLLQVLGDRLRKSLLILDEAHTAAPATASKYAIDSRVTRVIRDVAPRFEHRLFLSATPHNGHSNSFSSLLEILDPQRFTRGVPVTSQDQLEPVMVRRLKADLRALGESFPQRRVGQIELRHDGAAWGQRVVWDGSPTSTSPLGEGDAVELELATLLAEYTELARPEKGAGKLVFINLQKRLLSSVEAFARTLQRHKEAIERRSGAMGTALVEAGAIDADDDVEVGLDDDALDEAEARQVELLSSALPESQTSGGRARELLTNMVSLADRYRGAADAKVRAIVAWMQQHQCPGIALGGKRARGADGAWSDRRVILFTEYGDTKRYLLQLLRAAIEGTERAEERILQIHGGMSDESRAEVQRAFNGPPDVHPVRILVATDAAREGINLQGHCADLFHFDVPWNPARMEQRNGRIDRTLQASPEVRCMYFFYPQRREDEVLRALVNKVETIQHELGSIGSVVMERLGEALEDGITKRTPELFAKAEQTGSMRETAKQELESIRRTERLKVEIDEAGRYLDGSRRVMDFDAALLRDALDVGFELSGAKRMQPADATRTVWQLPELPESWQQTLDTLRPPREREEALWDWRKRPPQPVVFDPPDEMDGGTIHLHLQHPLAQRVLGRFLAQGFSAHDLSRVTILRSTRDSIARVIAFGRLTLFGPGAVRLHDELISVAAQWLETKTGNHLKPFADAADRKAIELLEQSLREAPNLSAIKDTLEARLAASAGGDFAALWPTIGAEADARAHDAKQRLRARGVAEGDALRRILERQREAIRNVLHRSQLAFDFTDAERDQRDQLEQDKKHMERRLGEIDKEIVADPVSMERSYDVTLTRLVPVGLIYLWPSTR